MGRRADGMVDMVGEEVDVFFCWLLFCQGNKIRNQLRGR